LYFEHITRVILIQFKLFYFFKYFF